MSTTHTEEDEIGQLALRPRDVHFELSDAPLHWIPGEPYASHWLSSVHFVFPAGEPFMADAVLRAGEQIEDPELREVAFGFAAQEMMHARAHDAALWKFLVPHGIDPKPFTRQADFVTALSQGVIDSTGDAASQRILVLSLAACSGVEMLATAMGQWLLDADLEKFGADPATLDMLRWHAAEEVEHRRVVFDVARYLGVGYLTRVAIGVATAVGIFYLLARATKFLAHSDRTLPNLGYFGLLREYTKASRRGALPPLRLLANTIGRYMKPSHTPEGEGNTAQAVAYLATSPAVRATAL
ncbi:metal-dependent hydrolase [Mycobacteroides abscessus]|uniref:metal-dependent hydrolase n=1 Tax=Mycobacteroides abscessus TaxID=36809 RepID=UPI000D83C618|nr:metal-dependent hydrolase [Mycobacteroides abscessus]SPX88024.1 metal-dependent hydrolase [Mycobacteroides abscessus]